MLFWTTFLQLGVYLSRKQLYLLCLFVMLLIKKYAAHCVDNYAQSKTDQLNVITKKTLTTKTARKRNQQKQKLIEALMQGKVSHNQMNDHI
jgi:hypothetical protein